MKNKILIPLLITAVLAAFFSFKYSQASARSSEDKRKLVVETVMKTIQGGHYSARPLDDTFSSRVYTRMLSAFDYEKQFLTKQDVNRLRKYQFDIDDEIRANSLEFFDSVDAIYLRRLNSSEKYYTQILAKPFTFTSNESIQTNPEKLEYASDESDLSERWRLLLKSRVLAKYMDLKTEQDKKVKDSANYKTKSDVELEAQAREDVKKFYGRVFKQRHKFKDDERFTLYVNILTEMQDPHTSYFPPAEKKNFDVAMSGSFFGIGAQLKEDIETNKIMVASIVTGSPSWKQGELKAGDEIQKVAQGDKTPVDIQGYEIDDVVKLIRGEKGTEVRLTVKKADGAIKVVPIKRDVVQLEETFAKSAIIKSKTGAIGYIRLPEFYADFNHTSGRSCAADIAIEVKKLKDANVSGIILDLRDNGGGSLGDVVDMSGLFVGKGPVVQVKTNRAAPSTLRAQPRDSGMYDGPLVIMVNQNSASASEILAAAMQDYKRAVIVGATTYGKGTVQKMVSLDDMVDPMTRLHMAADTSSDNSSIGALKLTMEKFYRINGGSTQLKGVTPDITIPDRFDGYDDEELGERNRKSALAWDEIAPSTYKPTYSVNNIKELAALSARRVSADPTFNLITENAKFLKRKKEDSRVSLNEVQYKKEQDEINAISKKQEELDKKTVLLEMTNPVADMQTISRDTSSVAKNTEWLKRLSKDIYISESVNIINDMVKTGMKVNMGTGMR
ncbi:MAG: carboxy terminal-processing peptidase [Bacteroidota bacterium]